jgi:hypothetical protein
MTLTPAWATALAIRLNVPVRVVRDAPLRDAVIADASLRFLAGPRPQPPADD